MIRASRSIVLAVALVATMTACGAGGDPGATPALSGAPTSPAAPTSPPASSPDVVTAPPCTRDSLTNAFAFAEDSAEDLHGTLTVSNRGADACSLSGYPTVYFGSNEAAVPRGTPSAPDPADPGAPLDLQPGGEAVVRVTIARANMVAECDAPVETSSLIYVLPGEAFEPQVNGQHVELPEVVQGCANDQITMITVGGFTAP